MLQPIIEVDVVRWILIGSVAISVVTLGIAVYQLWRRERAR